MRTTAMQEATTRDPARAEGVPELAYILKGYPNTSETFIANEIFLLELFGLKCRIFSVLKPEGQKRHAVNDAIKAPLTYLPPVAPLSQSFFPFWLVIHGPRFVGSHWRLFRLRPGPYLRTFAWMMSMCFRYRNGRLAPPNPVFFKEFLQAGYIALQVLRAPTVCHLHAHFGHGATTVAMFTSSFCGVPFSFTGHAKDIYRRDLNPGDLLRTKISRARFVVTCTGANVDYLRSLSSSRTRIYKIYHGLDTAKFAPTRDRQGRNPAAPPLILSVGRFVEKKGFDDLVRACGLLKKRGRRFACRIVGGHAEYADTVKELVRRLDLEDTVTLHHAVTQERLKEYYEDGAVFCLPCKIVDSGDRDGIPNVLAEAMAMEMPVVSTNISGIPEIVEDGVNGLLVPEKDPKAIADALELLLSSPGFARGLGIAARRTICEVFDSARNTVALKELFDSCLESDGRGQAPAEPARSVAPAIPIFRRPRL